MSVSRAGFPIVTRSGHRYEMHGYTPAGMVRLWAIDAQGNYAGATLTSAPADLDGYAPFTVCPDCGSAHMALNADFTISDRPDYVTECVTCGFRFTFTDAAAIEADRAECEAREIGDGPIRDLADVLRAGMASRDLDATDHRVVVDYVNAECSALDYKTRAAIVLLIRPLQSRCDHPDDCACRSSERTDYATCGCRAHVRSRWHARFIVERWNPLATPSATERAECADHTVATVATIADAREALSGIVGDVYSRGGYALDAEWCAKLDAPLPAIVGPLPDGTMIDVRPIVTDPHPQYTRDMAALGNPDAQRIIADALTASDVGPDPDCEFSRGDKVTFTRAYGGPGPRGGAWYGPKVNDPGYVVGDWSHNADGAQVVPVGVMGSVWTVKVDDLIAGHAIDAKRDADPTMAPHDDCALCESGVSDAHHAETDESIHCPHCVGVRAHETDCRVATDTRADTLRESLAMGETEDATATARELASEWHSGQTSALYSFVSSGMLDAGAALREAERAGMPYPVHSAMDLDALDALIAYLRAEDARQSAWIEDARERGADAARAAASWTTDGNGDIGTYRATLEMMRAGDPAIEDDRLPREPDLSGEYADAPTPISLAREISGDDDVHPDIVDAIAEAFTEAVQETFTDACETELRIAVGEITRAGADNPETIGYVRFLRVRFTIEDGDDGDSVQVYSETDAHGSPEPYSDDLRDYQSVEDAARDIRDHGATENTGSWYADPDGSQTVDYGTGEREESTAHPDGFTDAQLAEIGRLVAGGKTRERISEDAQRAFWSSVASDYPEISTGDLAPDADAAFIAAADAALAAWLDANATD